MKTAIIGFPRVGTKRELKFTTEKYFSGLVDKLELETTAKNVRSCGWKKQSNTKMNFIPSNDFSFYDNMLDTATMFNIIPKRYSSLGLDKLDTYFAMAHGYQGEKGDVKALAMKKWFNTNYHYIVPEIEDDVKLNFDSANNKPLSEYNEAKSLGVETYSTVIGPYTLLTLARYLGKKSRADFINDAAECYVQLAKSISIAGVKYISFAEPSLVMDLSFEDKNIFVELYKKIVSSIHITSSIKVILQTYFGDIRDCYKEVFSLGFDGIGLDFIEGKKNLELIKNNFPKNTLLFAGVICGKNIWRTDYAKTISTINEIKKTVDKKNIVCCPSCSLLHVPYTTANEKTLSTDILKHFSFAEEKLVELKEISAAFENTIEGEKALKENKKLFLQERTEPNEKVHNQIKNLTDNDFTRKPLFTEREAIQKREFNLPPLPTTTIGSFPQTKDVRANRSGYKKGTISKEQYIQFNKNKIAECIKLQEELGLDVLVHGEFERNDMVEYFGNHLDGYLFTENAWVQSYGTRCVKPPVIWSDVSRREAITVNWSTFAQSCTKKIVKGMLTGPVTILNWSFPREDISLKEQAFQIALAMKDEVLDLEKNGIKIIQIDEAALREKLPLRKSDWYTEYLDWAIPAFRLLHSKVKATTQIHTHMCYSEFSSIIKDIDNMDADVITFEASRSDLSVLDSLKEANFRTEVGPGVYDIHSPRIPSVEEIKTTLNKMIKKLPIEKLWVNPDCGLKTRGEIETKASLKNLVQAALEIREQKK